MCLYFKVYVYALLLTLVFSRGVAVVGVILQARLESHLPKKKCGATTRAICEEAYYL